MKLLTLIPARGGSKRIPDKNIISLGGKPLLYWTISAAQKSTAVSDIILSTDDQTIADVGLSLGASCPFMRPEALSTDEASTYDVVRHAITYFQEQGTPFDYVLVLQPTSPLRIAEDIDQAVACLDTHDAKAIVSVTKSPPQVHWSAPLPDDHCLDQFYKTISSGTRSQDLPDYYHLNGAIYLAEIDYFLSHQGFYGEKTFAYVMPEERSFDIDTSLDLTLCEAILNAQ